MSLVDKIKEAAHIDPYGNLGQEGTGDRLKKLLSPRWVANKIALTVYERRHPDHPWITQDAIMLFDALLRPHHRGLEWGSGNGTTWVARRCRSLTSIEHFKPWYEKVAAQMQAAGVTNVDYRFVEESAYVDSIDTFKDESLDFVVVDGLFRGPAFRRSVPKVKQDGFVVFDNANWYLPSDSRTPHSRTHRDGPVDADFAEVARLVGGWKVLWTTNGVNDTAIFIKPVR
jgi:predicted O-methyltransferase YrrM